MSTEPTAGGEFEDTRPSAEPWLYYQFGGVTAAEPEKRFILHGPRMVVDKCGEGFRDEEDVAFIVEARHNYAALQSQLTAAHADYTAAVDSLKGLLRLCEAFKSSNMLGKTQLERMRVAKKIVDAAALTPNSPTHDREEKCDA